MDGIQPDTGHAPAPATALRRRPSAPIVLLAAAAWMGGIRSAATEPESPPAGAGEAATAGAAESESDDAEEDAHVSGSLTLRSTLREGQGNDRSQARLGLEWSSGAWSGGFIALAENDRLDGALKHEDGVGSFDLPERWVAFRHEGRRKVDLRLGTTPGLRFAEGLVLGAATFDGVNLSVETQRRFRLIALAGRTDVVDPEEFFVEPITLFPDDDEFLGARGDVVAVRGEILPGDGVVIGLDAMGARTDAAPTARMAGVDLALSRGMLDLAAELAVREGGGHGLFVRTDLAPWEKVSLGVEHRRYRDFSSPLGNPPLYGGIGSADDTDETGWLVHVDFAPTARFSGSWSLDYSDGAAEGDAPRVKRDHRLELSFAAARNTAISYGFELEDAGSGHDGRMHSLLLTQAFERGGRLAARYSMDESSPERQSTLRLSWRMPMLQRRLTLLLDDTIRVSGGGLKGGGRNTFVAGLSVRTGKSSFVTLRGTVADAEADSLDLTWYTRF